MPTSNPRINITANEQLLANITLIAKQESKTVSAVAKEMIEDGIARREDMYFSGIALSRDKGNKKFISHKEVWK